MTRKLHVRELAAADCRNNRFDCPNRPSLKSTSTSACQSPKYVILVFVLVSVSLATFAMASASGNAILSMQNKPQASNSNKYQQNNSSSSSQAISKPVQFNGNNNKFQVNLNDGSLHHPHHPGHHHHHHHHHDHEGGSTLSSDMLKRFIKINNIRSYHLDLHSYRPSAKFAGDPEFVDSKKPEHLDRCLEHLQHYATLLSSFAKLDPLHDDDRMSMDAIRLADTFGRPEAGTIDGSQFWLGRYDSCKRFSHRLNHSDPSPSGTIRGQYCLAVAQFPNWKPRDSATSLKIGLCLPQTCTTWMLNEHEQLFELANSMMKSQFNKDGPYNSLVLRSIYCLPHETSQIRHFSSSAIWLLTLLGLMVMTSVIATLLDLNKLGMSAHHKNWLKIVVDSFSITRNLDRFFTIHKQEPEAPPTKAESTGSGDNTTTSLHAKRNEEQLLSQLIGDNKQQFDNFDRCRFFNSLTGIKCIGLLWIIAAHTFLVSPITGRNGADFDKLTKTLLADFYLTSHMMVDTFFVLSGILASYLLFKQGLDNIENKHWLVLTLHRYWRLTPIYLLCYWYTKTVGHVVNEGPLWDYATASNSPRYKCSEESWLQALLHLSDFKTPKKHCVPFAWFIANGIKFWILTPIFLIQIHKSIKRGYTLMLATLTASMALVMMLAYKSNIDVKAVLEFKPESANDMLNNMDEVYTRPYSRIGPYLLGLMLGHLVYRMETRQVNIQMSKNLKMFLWLTFGTLVFVLSFILKLANNVKLSDSANQIVFSIGSGLVRPLWALCTCWLVFALGLGQAKWLSDFLSANFWHYLVKLSFCGYLAQGEVIASLYLSVTESINFTYMDMIARPLVTIVATLVVAFLMVIFLELPLIGIERLILPSKRRKTCCNKIETQQVASFSRKNIDSSVTVNHTFEHNKMKSD